MAEFPTIFDLIARVEFLQGLPAAYMLFVTTFLIIVLRHWQATLFLLAIQYIVAGLLFVDVLDPRAGRHQTANRAICDPHSLYHCPPSFLGAFTRRCK